MKKNNKLFISILYTRPYLFIKIEEYFTYILDCLFIIFKYVYVHIYIFFFCKSDQFPLMEKSIENYFRSGCLKIRPIANVSHFKIILN